MNSVTDDALVLPAGARRGDALDQVDTPSLVLDLAPFEANLRAMQAWADAHGVALRPHAKAHKCPEIALRQLALGARGICCQKVSEALPFVAAGVGDILISNEVVGPAKHALLARLARHARMTVCVDDAGQLARLSEAMSRAGVQVDVLVELDVGQGRCGVSSPEAALALARQAGQLPGLRFAGLQAYHGAAQHQRGRAERERSCREAAARAAACVALLREQGLECATVTGGGTGSVEFDAASGVYTELQPGSYAFMDGDYGSNEWGGALAFQDSLFLLSTVMSRPAPDRAILDAGLKSTSAECGPPAVVGAPGLRCTAINDEHGVVRVEPGADAPALGSRLRLRPSHVDPSFNLHDELVVVRDGVVQDLWPIAARGLSR
jgi:D-serine deaminase-like pyridoxal phosphate-dependent protein